LKVDILFSTKFLQEDFREILGYQPQSDSVRTTDGNQGPGAIAQRLIAKSCGFDSPTSDG